MSASDVLDAENVYDLKVIISQTALEWGLHGIYTTMVVLALRKLLSDGWKTSLARRILVIVVFTTFTATSAMLLMGLLFYLYGMDSFLASPPDHSALLTRMEVAYNLLTRLNYIISDAIVIWRAWVLWPRSRIVQFILAFCMVGTIAATLTESVFVVFVITERPSLSVTSATILLGVPLLVTNLIATVLIGAKVWQYWRDIKANLNCGSSRRAVEKVLILLTESGCLYCVFWIVWIVVGFVTPNVWSMLYQLVTGCLPQVSALYPLAIIILVSGQRDKIDASAGGLSESIRFAAEATKGRDMEYNATYSQFPPGIGATPSTAVTFTSQPQWRESKTRLEEVRVE